MTATSGDQLNELPTVLQPEPPKPVPEATAAQMTEGAVTFLDVLGWKGIWLRRSPSEVVNQLNELVRLAERTARAQRGTNLASEVRVISISDTIVLLTEGSAESVLPVHGLICKELLCESIRMGIPLRGASSYGRFSASDGSIMVGPAIDEAASWHEALDWIGVVMTPTAEFRWAPKSPWRKYSRAPVKGLGAKSLWCIDWTSAWPDISDLKRLFADAGPMDTSIASKYLNTLEFANAESKPA